MKPGILDFNEENVPNYFVNEDGQVMIPKAPCEVLEHQSDPEDIDDIIMS